MQSCTWFVDIFVLVLSVVFLQETKCFSCERRVKVSQDEATFKYKCNEPDDKKHCEDKKDAICSKDDCCCNDVQKCNAMKPEAFEKVRAKAAQIGTDYRGKLRTCAIGRVTLETNQTDNQHAKLSMVCYTST